MAKELKKLLSDSIPSHTTIQSVDTGAPVNSLLQKDIVHEEIEHKVSGHDYTMSAELSFIDSTAITPLSIEVVPLETLNIKMDTKTKSGQMLQLHFPVHFD